MTLSRLSHFNILSALILFCAVSLLYAQSSASEPSLYLYSLDSHPAATTHPTPIEVPLQPLKSSTPQVYYGENLCQTLRSQNTQESDQVSRVKPLTLGQEDIEQMSSRLSQLNAALDDLWNTLALLSHSEIMPLSNSDCCKQSDGDCCKPYYKQPITLFIQVSEKLLQAEDAAIPKFMIACFR